MSKEAVFKFTKSLTVLFVEDEYDAREMGAAMFGLLFAKVYQAKNGEEGLALYREKKPDIIITDIHMPVMDGLAMIKEIRKEEPRIPVIVTTAFSDDKYFLESIRLGIDRYILKPIAKDECLEAVTTLSKRLFEHKEAAEYEKQKAEAAIQNARQEALKQAMHTDRLTNLANRFSLSEMLSFTPIASLLVVNIDRLKDINKIYGVKIGDKAILKVAQMLMDWSKSRFGFKVFCMGGDEFALYFLEACRSELEIVACEIIDKIESELFVIDDLEVNLSATVGIACNQKRPIEDAETALKVAKQKKIKFFVYEEELLQDHKQVNNILWHQKIKEALKDERIVPFYQPIVDTNSRQILKYECLVRLIEQDGAVISPYYFLDIAKQTRLYTEITRAVVKKSIEQCVKCEYEFSINLSVEDILSCETAEMIVAAVKDSGAGDRIIFEILESEGIENFEEVISFIDRLKTFGCRFSIDDFGTGYSNFIYLLKLNVDYLKIDGSLIQKLVHDENVRKAVVTIHSFAHSIGLQTVAEFVSDEAIYSEVKAIGIDYCQGYLFSQPLESVKKQGTVL